MTTTSLTIRIDTAIKQTAHARAERLGISLGTLVENDLRQFINGHPIIIDEDSFVPSERLLNDLNEAEREHAQGQTTSVPAAEISTYLDNLRKSGTAGED